jgi:hypothetical protein
MRVSAPACSHSKCWNQIQNTATVDGCSKSAYIDTKYVAQLQHVSTVNVGKLRHIAVVKLLFSCGIHPQ